ncbi:MAG: FG-GAP repeat protein [Phycisphaerales bacterium]
MNRSPGCSQDVLRLAGPIIIAMAILSPAARGQCAANELTKLTASDGEAGDDFAWSVSISGDTAIFGARQVDNDCPSPNPPQIPADIDCGAAYIFQVDADGTWGEVAKLTAADAESYDEFGYSVSLSGDTAIVGAHRSNEAGINSGSASIFRRDFGGPNNWGEVVELVGSDTAAGDAFARSVSISGDTAIVGAWLHDHDVGNSGSAYIFQRDVGGLENWGQVAELTAIDGPENGFIGWSVSLSGDTAIVGAWGGQSVNGGESGSAYIFQRDFGGPDNWGRVVKLTASDPNALDHFGFSVALSGDIAVVGAPQNDDAGGGINCQSGSAYIFQRDLGGPDNWGEVVKLIASDDMCGDGFGISVTLSGDIAIAGASGDDDGGAQSGSAYIFQRDAGGEDNWGEVVKLTASDAELSDNFGDEVSLDGETALVASIFDDDNGVNSGSAYVIGALSDCNNNGVLDLCDIADGNSDDDNNNGILDECECPWDLDGNGSVGAADLLSLLASWGPCKDCPADFDGNGNVGASDLLALLANWGPCP